MSEVPLYLWSENEPWLTKPICLNQDSVVQVYLAHWKLRQSPGTTVQGYLA